MHSSSSLEQLSGNGSGSSNRSAARQPGSSAASSPAFLAVLYGF